MQDTSLGPKTVHRFPSHVAAYNVMVIMRELTNVKLHVTHSPVSEEESKRGVGDWVIEYGAADSGVFVDYRMSRCSDMALTLALADALRKHNPRNPLLEIWHLDPDNRDSLPKYNGGGGVGL